MEGPALGLTGAAAVLSGVAFGAGGERRAIGGLRGAAVAALVVLLPVRCHVEGVVMMGEKSRRGDGKTGNMFWRKGE